MGNKNVIDALIIQHKNIAAYITYIEIDIAIKAIDLNAPSSLRDKDIIFLVNSVKEFLSKKLIQNLNLLGLEYGFDHHTLSNFMNDNNVLLIGSGCESVMTNNGVRGAKDNLSLYVKPKRPFPEYLNYKECLSAVFNGYLLYSERLVLTGYEHRERNELYNVNNIISNCPPKMNFEACFNILKEDYYPDSYEMNSDIFAICNHPHYNHYERDFCINEIIDTNTRLFKKDCCIFITCPLSENDMIDHLFFEYNDEFRKQQDYVLGINSDGAYIECIRNVHYGHY